MDRHNEGRYFGGRRDGEFTFPPVESTVSRLYSFTSIRPKKKI